MSTFTPIEQAAAAPSAGTGAAGGLKLEILRVEPADGAQFRAALERHLGAGPGVGPAEANKNSLGDRIITRATDLASSLKHDQQYVSKMLEQATRSADSMQLMKAMLALNDYQLRVQFVSKTASKAASSVDQLTKLQ